MFNATCSGFNVFMLNIIFNRIFSCYDTFPLAENRIFPTKCNNFRLFSHQKMFSGEKNDDTYCMQQDNLFKNVIMI